MRRPHKTMQCAYFCVHLSEAINGRSPIIENQTIQTKYSATNTCVLQHIYNNIYWLIKETGLYNRNTVLRFILYDLYKRMVLPGDNGRVQSANPLCRKFRPFIEVIKYEPEDFISTSKLGCYNLHGTVKYPSTKTLKKTFLCLRFKAHTSWLH